MKFRDIEQFTQDGNYVVGITLDYLVEWIHRQEKYGLNMDPDFQRGHVWNEQQQIAYVEYFLSGGKSGRDIYFNCVGWMDTFEGPFVLVDGKQRLTAMLKFFSNEIKAFGLFNCQYEDNIGVVDNMFMFHVNNLGSRKAVLKWYIEMNTGGVVHTDEEIDKVRKLLEEEQKKNG